jgi:DNA polymerase-1
LAADYSQVELRIIASISEDKGMIEAFNNSLDIHAATASKIFDVEINDVNKDMRRKAKTVNFGIIYGISAFGLSERLNIPRGEASNIIKQYFDKYPGIRKYMENTVNFAKEHGYVKTLKGRKRYIRDINSRNNTVRGYAERNAINAPIQGTAADMIKIAMINIHKKFLEKELKAYMILQVHDELVFDTPDSEIELIKPIIIKNMKEAIPLKVPVEIDMNTGENWLVAH